MKPIESFNKCKTTKDGYHPQCKECKAYYKQKTSIAYNKRYYEQYKEQILAKNATYQEANKEAISVQRRGYRERNQEYIKQKQIEYLPIRKAKIRERRQNDEDFRIKEILRSKVHKMLSGKNTSYKILIGCDIDMLRRWIEYQFDQHMTWDNLGSYWQIDHILPISKFDLADSTNQRICFSWTNLQPLHKIVNRQKSNRLELHYYFNSLITLHRFIQHHNGPYSGYQSKRESLCWLRKQLRYGKNPMDKVNENFTEMDNPQPSS